MPFAAFDLHKKEIEAVILDDVGQLVLRQRFAGKREAIEAFAQGHLSPEHQIVMEATFNTWAVVEIVQPYVKKVFVGNPLLIRAIADAKIKTDKIDALTLAHLLRLGYLPDVWIPDPATRALRLQTTERACLTADRTRLKNRIHAVLNQRLIQAPENLFEPEGLAWLRGLVIDDAGRQALNRLVGQLEFVECDLEASGLALAPLAYGDPRVLLLMTLPGVGFATAQVLLAALGDITRFRSGAHAASYIGLVPSTYQSGEHTYHGHITKCGSSHARWMLVEAAQHLDSNPGPLGHFFRKLTRKKCRNVAVVATARKLVTIAWHMLKNNEPYRYALPGPTEEKLRRLRVLATGSRRKTGPKSGQPKMKPLAPGIRSKTIKGLPAVYSSENLPRLAGRKPGEVRMLQAKELTQFADDLLGPLRIRKATNKAPSAV